MKLLIDTLSLDLEKLMGDTWARVFCAWAFPAFQPAVLNQCALVH